MTVLEMKRELRRAERMPWDELRFWYHECPAPVRSLVDAHDGTIRAGVRAALREFPE